MDGWMNGWVNGWMDRWMDGGKHLSMFIYFPEHLSCGHIIFISIGS